MNKINVTEDTIIIADLLCPACKGTGLRRDVEHGIQTRKLGKAPEVWSVLRGWDTEWTSQFA